MSIEYYLKRLKLAYYDKHLSIYNKDVDELLTPHFYKDELTHFVFTDSSSQESANYLLEYIRRELECNVVTEDNYLSFLQDHFQAIY